MIHSSLIHSSIIHSSLIHSSLIPSSLIDSSLIRLSFLTFHFSHPHSHNSHTLTTSYDTTSFSVLSSSSTVCCLSSGHLIQFFEKANSAIQISGILGALRLEISLTGNFLPPIYLFWLLQKSKLSKFTLINRY